MRDDRVASVDDVGIVAALVEHAEIGAQNGRVINIAAHRALVRADDHEPLFGHIEIGIAAQHRFEDLIGRQKVVETHQGHGVLHPRIVRVERDDLGHAHRHKLLQHLRAIERFARVAAMLSAAVKAGHHHRDRLSFAARRRDDALEVAVMIVRRHVILETEHIVSDGIVAHVAKDVKILAAHRLHHQTLAVARREPRADVLYEECVAMQLLALCLRLLVVPVDKIVVDLVAQLLCARQSDYRHIGRVFVKIENGFKKRSHQCLRPKLSSQKIAR